PRRAEAAGAGRLPRAVGVRRVGGVRGPRGSLDRRRRAGDRRRAGRPAVRAGGRRGARRPARAHGARADRAAPVPGLGCWGRGPPGPRHSGDGMTTARSRFIAAAFEKFVDQYFVPVWGTPARLVKATGFRKGAWALALLDRADVANALGYHDLTPDGLPLSKVFVQT